MRKLISILIFSIILCQSFAQTTLIEPSMEGGFENGNTAALNGWITSNSNIDKWHVGNAPGVFSGMSSAYISPDGIAWSYVQTNVVQHLYKTITVPTAENLISLNFKWKANGVGAAALDSTNLKVYAVPVSYTILPNVTLPDRYQISGTSSTFGMYKLSYVSFNDATINFTLIPERSYNIVFSWKSTASIISTPPSPAAIDDVFLTSRVPITISSTSIGGLWSSAETWEGGVVPENENVAIADGAIVTIDQHARVNNLVVGQGTSGILQWNNVSTNQIFALGNITISNGANLNMFSPVAASASPHGTSVNVGGDFINNGNVHAGYVFNNTGSIHASIFFNNANSNPILGGTGTFVKGIISSLFFETTGNASINTSQNIVTRSFAAKSGTLNTNGKLSIDNSAYIFGDIGNDKIYEIIVNNMGAGYSTTNPPIINIAAPANGITATAIPNIDNATGTLRSIKIVNAGSGYRTHYPAVTITGGIGSGAQALAVVNLVCAGTFLSNAIQSGETVITGGINIKSDQSIGSITVNPNVNGQTNGIGYTSAPIVGIALPSKNTMNLVTNNGIGYTSLPSVGVSGGTKLLGVGMSTDPTFSVVVAQGKVVSVLCVTGGTGWITIPTLTFFGGGGTGATCAFPTGCLAKATASISNGAVTKYTITNAGFGYPTPTTPPPVAIEGGGFTTAATAPTSRVVLYNLTLGKYAPAVLDLVHQENGLVPSNRRINQLIMNSINGVNFTNDLELYSNTPLTLTVGKINMGSSTLFASFPSYVGSLSTPTSSVFGKIKLMTQGGSLLRYFPFESSLVVNTGNGSFSDGSSLTSITASSYSDPSGIVVGAGYTIGKKGYRIQTNPVESYGTTPTISLNYSPVDELISDNQHLYIGQSATLGGPWNIKSIASSVGVLPITGSRTTATTIPGPILPTGDDFYAWISKSFEVYSIASGNWSNAAIWNTGAVPICADRVFINSTHTIVVNNMNNKCKSVIVGNTGNLVLQAIGNLLVGGSCP